MQDQSILVKKFISNKSEKSFRLLYNTYANDLMKTTLYLTNYDEDLAKDIFQETWITAIEKIDNFKHKSSFKTWITGILINKTREQNRKHKTYNPLEIVYNKKQDTTGNLNLAIDLKKAIINLPDGYRTIITLYDIQGFKHAEIAALLNISIGTSKSQLSHARKALRDSLKSYNIKNGKVK